ncbi:Subtilisin-like protease SBT1.8, partial [Mucuna pruriens]
MGNEPVGLFYSNKGSNQSASYCMPGSLNPSLVRGKVVVCDRWYSDRVEKGLVVSDAGGVGMILAKAPFRDAAGSGVISTPLAHGAGHVNAQKAFSPGLVYDASTKDYIKFLCSLDYTPEQIQLIAKRPVMNCTKKFSDPGQLNYPSFSVLFGSKRVVRYTLTLTNVGFAGSIYRVTIDAPPTVVVTVKPARLVFGTVGERRKYTVTFVSKEVAVDSVRHGFGSITWFNAQHEVRSPVGRDFFSHPTV